MKSITTNTLKLARNSLVQKIVRTVLVYSLLYITTSEIFVASSINFKNSKNEYLISINQNSYEINFNERSQRVRSTEFNRFNIDKSALTSDQLKTQYTEYFVNDTFYSVIFLLKICNSNHSFRAPPIY